MPVLNMFWKHRQQVISRHCPFLVLSGPQQNSLKSWGKAFSAQERLTNTVVMIPRQNGIALAYP